MLRCMFSGVSGLGAHQSRMDVIGNNIANVNTFGFKASDTTFVESIYQSLATSSEGNEIIGGTNASQVGYGANIGTIDLQFSSGTYVQSTSNTDIMLDGVGFFVVGSKPAVDADGNVVPNEPPLAWGTGMDSNDAGEEGNNLANMEQFLSGMYLTRVGDFSVDSDGYLVDGAGNVVYGSVVAGESVVEQHENALAGIYDTTDLVPIRIPAELINDGGDVSGALDYAEGGLPMTLSNLTIDSSGRLIANNKEGEIVTLGQLAVAVVQNPTGLTNANGPYYSTGGNAGKTFPYVAGTNTSGTIVGNGLESSNVDLSKEFSNMIITQRGFQACSKMITVADEMLQELVNLKR